MFAVIETGGKQYRVEAGDVIDVELVEAGEKGASVEFDQVLMVGGENGVTVGSPRVEGARVTGELVGEVKGPKVRVFKFKRRKQYRRTNGHRQKYIRVRIDDIAV